MRVVQTVLKNVCQHELTKVQFASGLIGVFGPNGVGKSNLLKMGLYADLTNDFSRNNKPKFENVTYWAEEKAASYVETEWEHNGESFVLVRGLQNPKRDTLRSKLLAEPLHKDGEIDAWLGKLLGLPNYKYLAANYVFVEQGKLTEFLSADQATRAKGFANLCGTDLAEDLWKKIGEQLTKDASLATEVVDNSDELTKALGDYERQLAEGRIALRKWLKRRLPDERKVELQAIADKGVMRLSLIRQLKTAKPDLAAAKEKYAEEKAKQKSLAIVLEAKRAAAGDAERRLELVRESLRTADEKAKQYAEHRRVSKELAGLKPPTAPAKREPTQEARKQLSDELGELRSELKRAQQIVKNMKKGELVECPECGTPVASMHKHLGRQKEICESYPAAIKEKEARQEEYDDILQQWETYRSDKRSYEETSAQLSKQLESMPAGEAYDADKRVRLKAKEQHYLGLLAAVTAAELELGDQAEPVGEAAADYKAEKKQLAKLRARLKECQVEPEQVVEAKRLLARHDRAGGEVAKHRANCDFAKREAEKKTAELATLKKRIKETARVREWRQLLAEMREVLHRDKLPKLVHEDYQERLAGPASEFLVKFRSPFTVQTAPNLGFVVTKPDGTLEAADGLSEGEQVMLALAIRWAVHDLSAATLGMLVLDEPTAGLDEANLSYLREALPQLGAEARSRGLQVIVVTHEAFLKPVFDQVIELKK